MRSQPGRTPLCGPLLGRPLLGLDRRGLVAGGAALCFAPAARAVTPVPFGFSGKLTQGGWMMVRTTPHARVRCDDAETRAGADGLALVGFDRDAPATALVAVERPEGWRSQGFDIAPVAYDVQRIDGLPTDQVAPSDPALLARIAVELKRKSAALASRADADDFAAGFVSPLPSAVRTSAFGPQRVLNGVPKTPHYGVDLAAPEGAPIRAPAAGLVVMAEPDMHFEGGLTLIDHGQGLVSMYLHQSRQLVRAGERVAQAQVIGAVGHKGRATGPHLCWRMTWRGRHMDPSLMLGARPPTA